jgi:5-methyltetrahydrofolate--homocysteine methyltransferase
MPFMEEEKKKGGASQKGAGKVLLATVKGDVHDIGKNIVGVVLGCNNYEVIDLGVMVPMDKILTTAQAEGTDIIGLSGLITPSLDEMVSVAAEMQRRGMKQPLLIGGATTSRQHTAVKVAPRYEQPVVHVLDASRAVNVVSSLLSATGKAELDQKNRAEQEMLRSSFLAGPTKPLVPFAEAVKKADALTFGTAEVAQPAFVGRRTIEMPLGDLVPYVDWTFFFTAWELNGKYPQIFEHPKYGKPARELFDHAQPLLSQLAKDGRVKARGAYGIWPANRDGEDVVLFTDETRTSEAARFPMLRQQRDQEGGPQRSLADFVGPRGVPDHVGAFAVTAGLGAAELVAELKAKHDDYSAILVQALTDRLAEAFAEALHEKVRGLWGHGEPSRLTSEELIAEKYRGIRPAFGYPACPDHTAKKELFALLGATEIGMGLTEHFAMFPAASVSGLYFAHPAARYFSVSRIGRDQLEDYARRKGMSVAEAERWLQPVLVG